MPDPLNIAKQIDFRRRLAANDAEFIAQAQDVVARCKTLLEEDPPNTFLGERHHWPLPKE
ncbi:hypothetical protein [Bradyrhizobium sp. STM 3562]|uniref:hypothetical protein n=1 Tax=Bradyrhizobium sp. STM 3562 TaxID=578924 RepID=UPI003890078D